MERHRIPRRDTLRAPSQQRNDAGIQPNGTSHASSSPVRTKRALNRLGWTHKATLVVQILLLGQMGYLAFLWQQSGRAQNSRSVRSFYYDIVDKDWLILSVTISSTVIRSIVAAQAGLATAMLASLLLETRGVRLSKLADVSILRSVETQPRELILRAPKDVLHSPLLAGLLTVLLLTTSILQPLSTILLSDFGDTKIPRLVNNSDEPIPFTLDRFGEGPTTRSSGVLAAYFQSPAEFPRFAENCQPPLEPLGGEERRFRDTGITSRAFLPLPKDVRQELMSYTGPATVVNTQVVCVRPNVSDFSIYSPEVFGYPQLLFATFFFSFDVPESLSSVTFLTEEARTSLSKPRNVTVPVTMGSVFSESDLPKGQDEHWSMTVVSPFARGFLLFNWTGDDSANWMANDSASERSWTQKSGEEWTTMIHRDRPLSIDLTYCLTGFFDYPYHIETSVGRPFVEPEVAWNQTTQQITTEDALTYLGVPNPDSRATTKSREILTMAPISDLRNISTALDGQGKEANTTHYVALEVEVSAEFAGLASYRFDPAGTTISRNQWIATLDQNTHLDSTYGVHLSVISIFQKIIQRTRNPALAIQSLLTMSSAKVYVEYQQYFDLAAPVRYEVWSPVFIPVRWTGFILFSVVVFTHCLAVMVVGVLFLRRTEWTEIGNSWQAVAQLFNETRNLVPSVCRYRSKYSKREMKRKDANGRHRIAGDWDDENSPYLVRT